MRDIKKYEEEGRAIIRSNELLDLDMEEVNTLYERFKETAVKVNTTDAILDLIASAFYMGIAIGSKEAGEPGQ